MVSGNILLMNTRYRMLMTRLVSWGVIIVNWLTIGSAEAENNLTTLMTQRNDHSNPKSGHLNTTTYNKDPNEQELQMRTRQASATTAEVPVFFMAASLKDEGGLLRSDGVRESWIKETELKREVEDTPQLERTWGESSTGWAEDSESWLTIGNMFDRGQPSKESLEPPRHHRLDV